MRCPTPTSPTPTCWVWAAPTETMAEIIALIEDLVAGGHAYEAGGDVYFAVRSFDRYGMLSNQRIDQLLDGAGSAEPGEHLVFVDRVAVHRGTPRVVVSGTRSSVPPGGIASGGRRPVST